MPIFGAASPSIQDLLHGAGVTTGFSAPSSTSLYFARWLIFNPSNSYVTHAFECDRAKTLIAVHCIVVITTTSGSPATAVPLYVRVNDTTDTQLGTSQAWSTPGCTYSDTNVNSGAGVALAAGDDYVFKFGTPAWSTNPTACFVSLIATYRR